VEDEQEHGELELLAKRQAGGTPHRPPVLAPDLLMSAGPPVTLAPVAGEGGDALLLVNRCHVVADTLTSQHEPQGEVGVLGDGAGVPAADRTEARGAHGAVGTAVGGQLEHPLPAVLVDQVAGQIVDRDQFGEQHAFGVADDAASLDGADTRVLEVPHEAAQDVGAGLVVGVEDDHDRSRDQLEGLVERA
jgi:hypothetical protein